MFMGSKMGLDTGTWEGKRVSLEGRRSSSWVERPWELAAT